MRAVTIHGIKDIRVEEVPDPVLRDATDALVQVTHSCVCGSDLWAYRGESSRERGQRIGHEFIGIVVETGPDVRTLCRGDRAVAPFVWSDGTCAACTAGLQTSCRQAGVWGQPGAEGAQGEAVRVPFADATLVRLPPDVDDRLLPAALTLADVMCTGHHAARSAGAAPGSAVAVVGDGAVGLCAVLAARRLRAATVILIGHHASRTALGDRFGATATIDSADDDPVERARELTDGRGFGGVVEAVGTADSMRTALSIVADGGAIGYVGVPHGAESEVDLSRIFYRNLTIRGGITPARAYIPELLPDVLTGALDPTAVFDLTIGLDDVPEAYAEMDARRALKPLIRL